MTVKGTCVHQDIMLMPVSETKEFVQVIARVRECDKCGEKVRTLELTEKRVEDERGAARERINVLREKNSNQAIVINTAIRALTAEEQKGKNEDGNKGRH